MRAKFRLPVLFSAFCVFHSAVLFAQSPAWWHARGAVDTNLTVHDYAPLNIGQLKWFASKARDEMCANDRIMRLKAT